VEIQLNRVVTTKTSSACKMLQASLWCNVVTADKLILEWDAFLASFNDLWEIKMEAIQMSTWSTKGGSSALETIGTKMQGPTAGFKHAIQPDGSCHAAWCTA
jgi:hypothetical protein